ncbi:aminotransferase class I/II-fold pyridoxal phosphate-dependent enzyme [archaeon]|nr:aminotransferase class I/II-fold pyridoxal phosphate-dependent enzyme [archaeon]
MGKLMMSTTMIKASERSKNVKYAIRDIAVIAKQVEKEKKVLYLNIGDPNRFDFDTPKYLKKAVINAMNSGNNYYADSIGIKEAVDALVKYNNKLGIETDAGSVMFTTGVSEAINVFIASIINPGENMIIPSPSYPLYSAYLDLFECEKKFHVLDEENGWNLDLADIERKITTKTRAITIINPNNPTGGVYDKKTLKGLVDIAGQYNLVILTLNRVFKFLE